jgi:hypothetical protein
VNDEAQRLAGWDLRRPLHDKLLRRGIDVALVERRWVDLVEQLAQLPHVHIHVKHVGRSGATGYVALGYRKVRAALALTPRPMAYALP